MATKTNQTELSGILGNRIAVQKISNRVVITNRPTRKRLPLTPAQESVKDRFHEAAHYARLQIANQEAKAFYQQRATAETKSAYIAAVTDYLTRPTVESIDATEYAGKVGDPIVIMAKDKFEVRGVRVQIRDSNGNLIEKGEAVMGQLHHWLYTATADNPSLSGTTIQAIVIDRPGNKATKEVTL